jgi:hypothetical protein
MSSRIPGHLLSVSIRNLKKITDQKSKPSPKVATVNVESQIPVVEQPQPEPQPQVGGSPDHQLVTEAQLARELREQQEKEREYQRGREALMSKNVEPLIDSTISTPAVVPDFVTTTLEVVAAAGMFILVLIIYSFFQMSQWVNRLMR